MIASGLWDGREKVSMEGSSQGTSLREWRKKTKEWKVVYFLNDVYIYYFVFKN